MAASIFLRSTDGNDGNAGTQKESAKATLASALTAAGAGGIIYMSALHAETQSSAMTLMSTGTAASPTLIWCVADWGAATGTGAPTTLSTAGTVTTTGNNNITLAGSWYGNGFAIKAGVGASGTASILFSGAGQMWVRLENGTIGMFTTGASSVMTFGTTSTPAGIQQFEFSNSTINFGAAGQIVRARGTVILKGCTLAGTAPTTLFTTDSVATRPRIQVEGCDLSLLGSGKNLVDVSTDAPGLVWFVDNKLGASVAITTGTIPSQGSWVVNLVNADSADTNYRFFRQTYAGTETHETTVVRMGGASDGATTVSRKIVTTSAASLAFPYESLPIEWWNTNLSAQTPTVPSVTDNVMTTDQDLFVEVEYLGTASFPRGNYVTGRNVNASLGSPANNATDSASSWGGSLGTPVKQSLVAPSLTCARAGLMRARVMAAKASLTVYYDPEAFSTSGRQYPSEAGMVNEGESSGVACVIGA